MQAYLATQHERGRPTVLAFPTLYPREVVTALDACAWERWSTPPSNVAGADAGKLQGYLCPTVRGAQSVLASLERIKPRARAAIIPHTCDSMQGLASIALSTPSWDIPIVTFRHPRGTARPASRLFLREEVLSFVASLERALDRKLEEVYKAARAKAANEVPPVLVAEQRGWVKGRDECWKAKSGGPAFLTATWQATNVRECVEGNYRIRISELQAKYRLVPSKGPVLFACENNPANELVATFFETDPPTARLERGDQTVTAWLVPAASGTRYEGQNVEFRTKGQDATATWLGAELNCRSK